MKKNLRRKEKPRGLIQERQKRSTYQDVLPHDIVDIASGVGVGLDSRAILRIFDNAILEEDARYIIIWTKESIIKKDEEAIKAENSIKSPTPKYQKGKSNPNFIQSLDRVKYDLLDLPPTLPILRP